MVSRYGKRKVFVNSDGSFLEQFKNRGVRSIKHYATANLKYPTAEDLNEVTVNVEIYKTGDRYYKLAQKYYNDSTYWWVIAHFNQKPTENMFQLGDVVYIPTPLVKILEAIEG